MGLKEGCQKFINFFKQCKCPDRCKRKKKTAGIQIAVGNASSGISNSNVDYKHLSSNATGSNTTVSGTDIVVGVGLGAGALVNGLANVNVNANSNADVDVNVNAFVPASVNANAFTAREETPPPITSGISTGKSIRVDNLEFGEFNTREYSRNEPETEALVGLELYNNEPKTGTETEIGVEGEVGAEVGVEAGAGASRMAGLPVSDLAVNPYCARDRSSNLKYQELLYLAKIKSEAEAARREQENALREDNLKEIAKALTQNLNSYSQPKGA